MDKNKYTYKLISIFGALLIYELVFWVFLYFIFEVFGVFSGSESSEKLIFLTPQYKWWLLLIPVLFFAYYIILRNRNKIANNATPELAASFLKPVSNFKTFIRFFLLRNAIAFLILGALQPAFGSKKVKGKVNGVEMVFAVDISASMNTKDMDGKLSRLDVSKRAINQLINQTKSGRIGIVAFAAGAYPQLPLTADFGAAKMYTEELSTDLISNQGTDIGQAIDMATEFFSKEKTKKIIVLITDGEEHDGELTSSIKNATKAGVEICVLGLGSKSGGLVPKYAETNKGGYLKDNTGKSVLSRLNQNLIKKIATTAKGEYVISDDAYPNVTPLLAQINNFKTTKKLEIEFDVKENRYQVFLLIAIVFLIFLLVFEDFGKFRGLNIFTRE